MALWSSTRLAKTSAVLAGAMALLLAPLSGVALAQGGNGGTDQFGDTPGTGELGQMVAQAASL